MTEDQFVLLCRAYVRWENSETGAPAIDSKRPYGNSYVPGDVADILGWKIEDEDGELTVQQYDKAMELHKSTESALRELIYALPLLKDSLIALKVLEEKAS